MLVSIRRLFVAALCAALLVVPLRAARAATPADVVRATLDNGMRVVVVRNPLAPVVTTVLNYLVGSNEAPAGFPGTAHAQEHMMFRSSTGLSTAQLADISALLGGDFDADTQQSVTQYFFTVPAQYLDIALHVEATRMSGVLDSQAEWATERGAIEQEVSNDLSGAMYRFHVAVLADLFAGTPYAHDALGTRPSFDKTTGALLKRFHDRWYAPNNAILVIVGNVDPPATLERVKALFGKIPARPLPPRPKFDFGPVTPKQITLASAYAVPFVVIAYRTPGYDSPDAPALTIAADVLNSERGALFALQADGKALGTGVQLDILPKAGIATAYIATAPGSDTAAAQRLLESTLAAYRRDGVAADLVAAAKRQEIAQAQFTRNSISEVAFDWSQALALEGIGSPSARVARLSAVTTADVKRVIRTYFDDRSAVVGVLVPKGAGAASPSRGFGGQESFAPSKTTAVALPGWAQPLLEQPKIVAPELHPVDQTLANGIRLIVIPTTISPTVLVRGGILHRPDLQEPAGQAGVDGVLDGMFAYGTTDLNRIAFQTALDTIAANESAGSSFSLDVPAGRFDRGMQLLADNLLHPALPAAAFKIVQKQTAQSLAGEATSPGYLAHRALLHALLPPNDAELRQATPQTVGALTEQAVRAYYATVFRPDLTTIVVAGDVTPERARAVVEKWFGDWHATGPKPTVELPPVPSNGPAAVDVPATGRLQASVTLEETLGVKLAGRDYHALELGNSVLGGGFYATRFYRDLREKAGLVYFVGAHIAATKTRATYTVTFGSDPQNVPKARAIIDGDLRSMAQTDATPAELRLAKTTIVRDLALSGASLGAVAGEQLGYALQGLPPDQFIRAVREIVGLDAADVRAAFAKWIDPARFVQVTEGPAPK